jgi:hypothetical protein
MSIYSLTFAEEQAIQHHKAALAAVTVLLLLVIASVTAAPVQYIECSDCCVREPLCTIHSYHMHICAFCIDLLLLVASDLVKRSAAVC